ncbi:MAG: protein TolR [Pseudomonadota bacterium]
MAAQLQNTGRRAGNTGRTRSAYKPMSEINVTPFVDVMLVLLIVFMVTAPLLTVGVPVDLPKTNAQALTAPEEPVVVSVDAAGRLFISEREVGMDQIVPLLRAVTREKPDTTIYVRGDRTINYGRVVEVMGTITTAGFQRVSLVAELPKPQ